MSTWIQKSKHSSELSLPSFVACLNIKTVYFNLNFTKTTAIQSVEILLKTTGIQSV